MGIFSIFRKKEKPIEDVAASQQVSTTSRAGWTALSSPFGFYHPPIQTVSGELITEEIALTIDSVFACVRVVSNAVANAPWGVFAIDQNENRIPRTDVPAYKLLAVRPNPLLTPVVFKQMMVFTAMIWGDFYAEIERDVAGRPLALWPVHPNRVSSEFIGDRLVYRVTNGTGEQVFVRPEDMFHVHGESVEARCGLSIVGLGARTLGLAIALENFGSSYFGNGINPGHILTLEEALPPEVKENLRQQIRESQGHGASSAMNLMVLDMAKGATFQKIRQTPNEAQFLESKKFSVLQVCRWFGVPPHMIAELERATFSNIEEQGMDFYRQAVLPWATRAAQEADLKLFQSSNSRVFRTRFDLDYLVEGNLLDRTEACARMLQNGVITRNEARRKLGFNTVPEEGADMLTVQVNMTTLDFLVKQAEEMPAEESPANKRLRGPGGAPTDEGNAKLTEAHRALVEQRVEGLLRREANKVGSLLDRGYPLEKFEERMNAFYDSHEKHMMTSTVAFVESLCVMANISTENVASNTRDAISEYVERMRAAIPALYDRGLVCNDEGVKLLTDIILKWMDKE